MAASVIAERMVWTRSDSVFRHRVVLLRPLYTPPELYQLTEYEPWRNSAMGPVVCRCGDYDRSWPVPQSGRCGWERQRTRAGSWPGTISSRETCDLITGHWQCLRGLGACASSRGVRQRRSSGPHPRSGRREVDAGLSNVLRCLGHEAGIAAREVPQRQRPPWPQACFKMISLGACERLTYTIAERGFY